MRSHPEGKPCSDVGRVFVIDDPPARYEGEWERIDDPQKDITTTCWHVGIYNEEWGNRVRPYEVGRYEWKAVLKS